MPFNSSHVCFACRRVVRTAHSAATCPQCGAPTRFLGTGFKPPKRRDVGAWRDLEQAVLAGKRFPGACPCCKLGGRPKIKRA